MVQVKDKYVTVEDLKVGFDYNKGNIGDLTSLTTTTKTDLVSAINEIKGLTSNTYSSTGTVPISGKAVAEALSGLNVAQVGGTGKYLSAISETDGIISPTMSDISSTYSSTDKSMINGVGLKDAISTLSYTDTAVAHKYVSAIEETNGIISVTREDLTSENVTYDNTNPKTPTTAINYAKLQADASTLQEAIDNVNKFDKVPGGEEGACYFYTNTFKSNALTIAAGSQVSAVTTNGFSDVVNSGYYPVAVLGFVAWKSGSSDDTSLISLDGYYLKNGYLSLAASNRSTTKSATVILTATVLFVKAAYYDVVEYRS